jgi:hypothetical protein
MSAVIRNQLCLSYIFCASEFHIEGGLVLLSPIILCLVIGLKGIFWFTLANQKTELVFSD